mmetsp:Transcript_12260/g.34569  ORF Transcript_12260/g.34569 Transcript_12260/m.34569 type:complete len:244 (+) Transcript_12260:338-1069(+)
MSTRPGLGSAPAGSAGGACSAPRAAGFPPPTPRLARSDSRPSDIPAAPVPLARSFTASGPSGGRAPLSRASLGAGWAVSSLRPCLLRATPFTVSTHRKAFSTRHSLRPRGWPRSARASDPGWHSRSNVAAAGPTTPRSQAEPASEARLRQNLTGNSSSAASTASAAATSLPPELAGASWSSASAGQMQTAPCAPPPMEQTTTMLGPSPGPRAGAAGCARRPWSASTFRWSTPASFAWVCRNFW